MGSDVFLYDHKASSGMESMNNANKEVVHVHSTIDPVNLIMLLIAREVKSWCCLEVDNIADS